MKSIAIAVLVAISAVSTAAVAAPIDTDALSVHGVFGGNNYGR